MEVPLTLARDNGSSRARPGSKAGLSLLAVDHDEQQLDGLLRSLRASSRVRDIQVALGAYEALLAASHRHFDVVFLDLGMPDLDGLEIANVLDAFALHPAIVFVAESDREVAAAFRLGAVDYLVRPVAPQRAEAALERVQAAIELRESVPDDGLQTNGAGQRTLDGNVLVVGGGRAPRVLVPRSILYLQAYGDYMRIFADSGRYLVRGRLAEATVRLGADGFLRVHRKYLVNLRRAIGVQPLENGTAMLCLEDHRQVPVARRHVRELRQRLKVELGPTHVIRRTRRQACGG